MSRFDSELQIMNYKIYSKLYNLTYKRKFIPMRLVKPFMGIMERLANKDLEQNRDAYLNLRNKDSVKLENVIVSFTSFPKRIENVWKTVLSLKNQLYLPEKIILWLCEEEFPGGELPTNLRELQDELFEIRFVDTNLYSYKKFYYAFKEFPDKIIVTVDDDVYYPDDTLKTLANEAKKYPGDIISNRVREIGFSKGNLLPYNEWKAEGIKKRVGNLFLIGVGGVWYPPDEEYRKKTLDKEKFLSLAPFADDLWLNAIAYMTKRKIRYTGYRRRQLPIAPGSPSLESKNRGESLNDSQLKNMTEAFGNFFREVNPTEEV